jgi:hypothetical protein
MCLFIYACLSVGLFARGLTPTLARVAC